jgi:hypothetical protein
MDPIPFQYGGVSYPHQTRREGISCFTYSKETGELDYNEMRRAGSSYDISKLLGKVSQRLKRDRPAAEPYYLIRWQWSWTVETTVPVGAYVTPYERTKRAANAGLLKLTFTADVSLPRAL